MRALLLPVLCVLALGQRSDPLSSPSPPPSATPAVPPAPPPARRLASSAPGPLPPEPRLFAEHDPAASPYETPPSEPDLLPAGACDLATGVVTCGDTKLGAFAAGAAGAPFTYALTLPYLGAPHLSLGLTVTTCHPYTATDTVVEVYASCSDSTLLGENDDDGSALGCVEAPGVGASTVELDAGGGGNTVLIAVRPASDAVSGDFALTVLCRALEATPAVAVADGPDRRAALPRAFSDAFYPPALGHAYGGTTAAACAAAEPLACGEAYDRSLTNTSRTTRALGGREGACAAVAVAVATAATASDYAGGRYTSKALLIGGGAGDPTTDDPFSILTAVDTLPYSVATTSVLVANVSTTAMHTVRTDTCVFPTLPPPSPLTPAQGPSPKPVWPSFP